MKIGLTADLHLDKRLGHRVGADGVNLRSRDLEAATREVIDGFIREKVDIAVFAGDLFDNAKPSERSRQFLVGEIRRLAASLPAASILLLRGNHDAATAFSDATAIGTAALALPGVTVADAFEPLVFTRDGVAVTLVPWMRNDAAFITTIEAMRPVEGFANLLVLHAGMADLPEYAEMRPGSQTITRALIPTGFDHIFSGHFHGHRDFPDLGWTFIGSPERLSVAEVGQAKGFLVYDTQAKRFEQRAIRTRPWYDLGTIDASAKDASALIAEIESIAAALPDWGEALVRLRVEGVTPETYASLDVARINALRARAFHSDIEFRVRVPELAGAEKHGEDESSTVLLDDLASEWSRFIDAYDPQRSPEERERLRRIGIAALERGSLTEALAGR